MGVSGNLSRPFCPQCAAAHFFDYMVGQFSKLECKSIEPMALQVEGGTIRGLQRFISDSVWDEEQMRWNYHQLVAEEMGDPDGVRTSDETGFVKRARTLWASRGSIVAPWAKWRIVRLACSPALRHGRGMPWRTSDCPAERWWTDAYAARRTKCNAPAELMFQSKPQLAAAMLEAMAHEGLFRSSILWPIASMAIAPPFWTLSMRVSGARRSWRSRPRPAAGPRPRTADKRYRYKGEARAKRVVVP